MIFIWYEILLVKLAAIIYSSSMIPIYVILLGNER